MSLTCLPFKDLSLCGIWFVFLLGSSICKLNLEAGAGEEGTNFSYQLYRLSVRM